MKAGMGFAFLAGIVCFAAMATQFDPENPDVLVHMGLYLLWAVIIFAVAGGFSKYAQWSRPVLGGMIFLVAGMAIAFYMLKCVPLWFLVTEVILCVCMLITLSSVHLKGYLDKQAD